MDADLAYVLSAGECARCGVADLLYQPLGLDELELEGLCCEVCCDITPWWE